MALKRQKRNLCLRPLGDGDLIIVGEIVVLLSRLKELYGPEAATHAVQVLSKTWKSTTPLADSVGEYFDLRRNSLNEAKRKAL